MCLEPSGNTRLERTLAEIAGGRDGNHPFIRAYLGDPHAERAASLLAQLCRLDRGPGLRPPSSFLLTLD